MSLLTYVMSSDETYDGTGDLGFSIYDQICNLRRQAHSAAQQKSLDAALEALTLEDPSVVVGLDRVTGQQV